MLHKNLIGLLTLVFTLTNFHPWGVHSSFADDALRPTEVSESHVLKKLVAGLEETQISRGQARTVLQPYYPDWDALSRAQRTTLIDQYAGAFAIGIKQFRGMMDLVARGDALDERYPLSDIPFPQMRPPTLEEIERGKLIRGRAAFLLGAGGAGGRLFQEFKSLHELEHWDQIPNQDRAALVKEFKDLVIASKQDGPQIPADPAAITEAHVLQMHAWFSERLIITLGLTGTEELARLRTQIDQGEVSKLTFPLGKGFPPPLTIWLKTLGKMNPDAPIVAGISDATETQILRYLRQALRGQHGSPKGTFFGLNGPIALVSDAAVPVVNASTGMLAAYYEDGRLYQGGAGGAGSIEALAQPIRVLYRNGHVRTLAANGFEWIRERGGEYVFIIDADTVGTTEELVFDALGLMERHNAQGVAFAYPHPEPVGGKPQPRGRLVNVIMDPGLENERRVMINREAFEVQTVNGLPGVLKATPNREVPANAGLYVVAIDPLEQMVQNQFPWHVSPPRFAPALGYAVRRFEKFKPDIYELLAQQSDSPLYIPVVQVGAGEIIPIKNAVAVEQARARYRQMAGLEELWPKTDALQLAQTEVIIPHSAFAGRGDAAHLVKMVDALNARGVTPTVLLLDEGEGAEAARQKLSVVASDYPNLQVRLIPEGELEPFAKRPIILEVFTVVAVGLRDRAHQHVSKIAGQNRSGEKPVVLAIHAPPSREPWRANSDAADTLNLFMELPETPGAFEADALYSGYLYDRLLQQVASQQESVSRAQLRDRLIGDIETQAPLAQVYAAGRLNRQSLLDSFWIFRYTSVLGNTAELEVLQESSKRLAQQQDQSVVVFTFYSPVNDDRSDYAQKYGARYVGHTPLVDQIRADEEMSFVDLSGSYDDAYRPEARVTVVNLPALEGAGTFTRLMGASDLADVTGMFTLLEALGLVVSGVGPVPIYFPTLDSYETFLTRPLAQMGNQEEALGQLEVLNRPMRGDSDGVDAAIQARMQLVTDSAAQDRYRHALTAVATLAADQLRNPALVNHFNLLGDTLGAIDRGEALETIVQQNVASVGLESKQDLEVVADAQLADRLKALVAHDTVEGLFLSPPSPTAGFLLPKLHTWVQFIADQQPSKQAPPFPEGAQYCCFLDEARLQHRGENSFRWRSWYVHGGFTAEAEGHAVLIADRHEIRPLDSAKMADMVDLALLLPGYRVIDNSSRMTPEGRIVHMGRSTPGHDHIHAVPKTLRVEAEQIPDAWENVGEADGILLRRARNLSRRLRLIEGSDRDAVVAAAAQYVSLLDQAIQEQPEQFQGYNTSVVSLDGSRIQVYLVPRTRLFNPEIVPTDENGNRLPRDQYRALPDQQRKKLYFMGASTPELMGIEYVPDWGSYLRLKQDPERAAQVISKLYDTVTTPESALRGVDAAFLGGAGLEELVVGQAAAWRSPEGALLGQVVPILGEAGEVVGRALRFAPKSLQLVSAWNPAIDNEDFPRWLPTPPASTDDPVLQARLKQGKLFPEWLAEMQNESSQDSGQMAFLASSLRSNFNQPFDHLIVDGEVVLPRWAKTEQPLDAAFLRSRGYDDALWTLVLEPGPPRMTALRYENNVPVAELLDVKIKGGSPVSESVKPLAIGEIQHAISAVPLLLGAGEDVTGQIRTSQGVHAPNELPWPLDYKAAFSVLGVTSGGRHLVHLAITKHISVRQLTALLRREGLDLMQAGLLIGSSSLHQWACGTEPATITAEAGPDSMLVGMKAGGAGMHRLNAVLAGYKRPVPTGLEEIGRRETLPSAQQPLSGALSAEVPSLVPAGSMGNLPLVTGTSAQPQESSAGLEEGRFAWMTNWRYRPKGRDFLKGLQAESGLPLGFSVDDRTLQARFGRILSPGFGWKPYLRPAELMPIFADSSDGLQDLKSVEAFVTRANKLPRADYSRAGTFSSDEGYGYHPDSLWENKIKPLLRQAVEYAREHGGFKLVYTPSVVSNRYSYTESAQSNIPNDVMSIEVIVVSEPATLTLEPADSLPGAGLEETPPLLETAQAYINQPAFAEALTSGRGTVVLPPAEANRLFGAPIALITQVSETTTSLGPDNVVFVDTDQRDINPDLFDRLPAVSTGSTGAGTLDALPWAHQGDLFLAQTDDLTRAQITAALTNTFPPGQAPRVVMAGLEDVQNLTVKTIITLWTDPTLPDVVIIGIVVQIENQAGDTFQLIVAM